MKIDIDSVVNTMNHNELKAEFALVCAELNAALDDVEDLKAQMLVLDASTSKHPKALVDYFNTLFGSTPTSATPA